MPGVLRAEREGEGRAAPDGGLGRDPPAVAVDDALDDREAEPRPFEVVGRVEALEHPEDPLSLARVEPHAVVAHPVAHLAGSPGLPVDLDATLRASAGELQRVREQVLEDDPQETRVGQTHRQVGGDDDLLKDRLARLPQALEQALEQRRLRIAEAQAHGELRIAHEETIRRLSIALDSRSSETGLHVIQMSILAERLAERLGVPEDQLAFLPLAAAMHDIGKIGISDSILEKPGPLTADERTVMERHTTIGHDILSGSGSELLELAAEIALTHHERWDGSGYPNGLSRDGIPLPGRIAAVADVFDALTADRVYRGAFSEDEALRMMREGRGSHFDPDVLDTLFELVDEDAGRVSGA